MYIRDEIDRRESTLVLSVPESKAVIGRIIGKAGSWISHLERSCGVRASVAKAGEMPTGSTERRITVTGPVPECISAMQRITRFVEEKLTDDIGSNAVLKIVVP